MTRVIPLSILAQDTINENQTCLTFLSDRFFFFLKQERGMLFGIGQFFLALMGNLVYN